jgi:hypothetical protein
MDMAVRDSERNAQRSWIVIPDWLTASLFSVEYFMNRLDNDVDQFILTDRFSSFDTGARFIFVHAAEAPAVFMNRR